MPDLSFLEQITTDPTCWNRRVGQKAGPRCLCHCAAGSNDREQRGWEIVTLGMKVHPANSLSSREPLPLQSYIRSGGVIERVRN